MYNNTHYWIGLIQIFTNSLWGVGYIPVPAQASAKHSCTQLTGVYLHPHACMCTYIHTHVSITINNSVLSTKAN